MAESREMVQEEFWLFREPELAEIAELRKFIDPEIDLSSLEGITELFDSLNHLLG
ncbi:MAG: hypothetical protein HXY34_11805 [Candidatus Thorarchaeota archaeon]|nr:hypothetical protein [Candidatus Thorarchaeota archaeon]